MQNILLTISCGIGHIVPMILSGRLVEPQSVYSSWFFHELKTRPDVKMEYRRKFIEEILPSRVRYPAAWYQSEIEPALAQEFIVGQWKGWTEWSQPEGTYFRIAQRLRIADKLIPEREVVIMRQIAASLKANQLAFDDDPLIIRGYSLSGEFTVIEGHHRATAVALSVAEKRNPPAFAAFVGVDEPD